VRPGVNDAEERDLASINARLAEAAERGEEVEVILVLSGCVRRVAGTDRWRIRAAGRRVVTFRAESVVAATPAAAVRSGPRDARGRS
jgi:hypothetical protein